MTYIITSNKPNLSATLHVTANCVLTIAGNNSVSNVAFSDEILTGAYINQISWACVPGAYLKVLRGTSIAGIYDSSSTHDYSGCGMPLKIGLEKDLSFNFLNGTGFCTIELQKIFEPIATAAADYTLNLDFTNQSFYVG